MLCFREDIFISYENEEGLLKWFKETWVLFGHLYSSFFFLWFNIEYVHYVYVFTRYPQGFVTF